MIKCKSEKGSKLTYEKPETIWRTDRRRRGLSRTTLQPQSESQKRRIHHCSDAVTHVELLKYSNGKPSFCI